MAMVGLVCGDLDTCCAQNESGIRILDADPSIRCDEVRPARTRVQSRTRAHPQTRARACPPSREACVSAVSNVNICHRRVACRSA